MGRQIGILIFGMLLGFGLGCFLFQQKNPEDAGNAAKDQTDKISKSDFTALAEKHKALEESHRKILERKNSYETHFGKKTREFAEQIAAELKAGNQEKASRLVYQMAEYGEAGFLGLKAALFDSPSNVNCLDAEGKHVVEVQNELFVKFPTLRVALMQACHLTNCATCEEILAKLSTVSQNEWDRAAILHFLCHSKTGVNNDLAKLECARFVLRKIAKGEFETPRFFYLALRNLNSGDIRKEVESLLLQNKISAAVGSEDWLNLLASMPGDENAACDALIRLHENKSLPSDLTAKIPPLMIPYLANPKAENFCLAFLKDSTVNSIEKKDWIQQAGRLRDSAAVLPANKRREGAIAVKSFLISHAEELPSECKTCVQNAIDDLNRRLEETP